MLTPLQLLAHLLQLPQLVIRLPLRLLAGIRLVQFRQVAADLAVDVVQVLPDLAFVVIVLSLPAGALRRQVAVLRPLFHRVDPDRLTTDQLPALQQGHVPAKDRFERLRMFGPEIRDRAVLGTQPLQ